MTSDFEAETETLEELAEVLKRAMWRFEKQSEFIALKLMHDEILKMIETHQDELKLAERMAEHDKLYRKY